MKDISNRRAKMKRAKARVLHILKNIFHEKTPSAKRIGHMAATHTRPCSCEMCRNKTVAIMRDKRAPKLDMED